MAQPTDWGQNVNMGYFLTSSNISASISHQHAPITISDSGAQFTVVDPLGPDCLPQNRADLYEKICEQYHLRLSQEAWDAIVAAVEEEVEEVRSEAYEEGYNDGWVEKGYGDPDAF